MTKISGQADSVAALDDRKGRGDSSGRSGDGKVTSTISADGRSAGSANGPPLDAGGSGFNYYGWVPASVGVLVLVAVLIKGRRRLQAEAGENKK